MERGTKQSAEARRRISESQRRRWALKRLQAGEVLLLDETGLCAVGTTSGPVVYRDEQLDELLALAPGRNLKAVS